MARRIHEVTPDGPTAEQRAHLLELWEADDLDHLSKAALAVPGGLGLYYAARFGAVAQARRELITLTGGRA